MQVTVTAKASSSGGMALKEPRYPLMFSTDVKKKIRPQLVSINFQSKVLITTFMNLSSFSLLIIQKHLSKPNLPSF